MNHTSLSFCMLIHLLNAGNSQCRSQIKVTVLYLVFLQVCYSLDCSLHSCSKTILWLYPPIYWGGGWWAGLCWAVMASYSPELAVTELCSTSSSSVGFLWDYVGGQFLVASIELGPDTWNVTHWSFGSWKRPGAWEGMCFLERSAI